MQATKCVTQPYLHGILDIVLRDCLTTTYSAVHYGKENGIDNRKGMKEFYRTLKETSLLSCYKVAAITRACMVLKSRKKSERRGVEVRYPKPLAPMVCIISGFFVTMKGRLFIPIRRDEYVDVQLNDHIIRTLEGKKIRSLTITPGSLSFCYSEEVESIPVRTIYGVDRNEKNITFGNRERVVRIDLNEMVRMRQTTREILGSFKRNDVRMRRKLARKYWKRATDRSNQMLHAAANFMVRTAVRSGAALALEDLTHIRRMYRRGSGESEDYRFRLNSWPHWKAKRMLEYKAAWKGVTVISLTKSETYGSSSMCSACGEKLHIPAKGDVVHKRMLWCQACKVWIDRDVNAALNLSQRGLARFASSLPKPVSRSQQESFEAEDNGLAGEAVKGNGTQQTLILRVDASKLTHRLTVDTTVGHSRS